jgi:DNA-binding beta-propeller fold protein YncE
MIKRIFYGCLFLVLYGVILVSCSRGYIKSTTPAEPVIYPPPPDTTRVQYLTSISTSTDVTGKQTAFNKFIFGEEVPKPIVKPYGVTVYKSKVYICDSGQAGIVVIDFPERSFNCLIPSGRGQLQLPLNCAVDEKGFLFVADGKRRQIVVFDGDGKYVTEFGELVESFKPTDIAIFKDKIYVVSVKDQRILVYDKSTYRLLKYFPEMEPGDEGYLYQPTNLFVDQRGIYVSDMGDNKIKVYSPEGNFLRSVGESGALSGQLSRPKGISLDTNSNLFVVDAAFENVQIYNREGKVLMFFGGPYSKPGDMWLPADVTISYSCLEYFRKYVDDDFNLKYIIFVTNQYGPDKLGVYGFVEPVKQ